MYKILFIGGNLSHNKGGAALIISAKASLLRLIPGAQFAISSFLPDSDEILSLKHNIELVSEGSIKEKPYLHLFFWLIRVTRILLYKMLCYTIGIRSMWVASILLDNDSVLKKYRNSDLIIEISGDGLTGDYGFNSILISFCRIYAAILLRRKIIIYAQSIGPFRIKYPLLGKESKVLSYFCKYLAKWILNSVSLITAREKITLNNLKVLGISNSPICLTSDSAFLLPSSNKEELSNLMSKYDLSYKEALVGISASQSINKLKYNSSFGENYINYKEIMSRIIEKVVVDFGARIIFVPHVIGPGNENDDRIMSSELYKESKYKDKILLINDDLSPEELKALIGMCDIFIGSRMHANIAALSMRVPTIAIGYSHKTKGIMKAAGLEEFVYNLNEFDINELMNALDYLYRNKQGISEILEHNLPSLESKSFCNAILASNILFDNYQIIDFLLNNNKAIYNTIKKSKEAT
ncbi:MAG: polysaccharide pyruvyl transferase family protein [Methanothrix sp.]